MLRLLLLALLLAATPLHAVMWKDDTLGCSVLLPDSRGWQKVPIPEVYGVTTLVCVLHQERQAAFGVAMLKNAPSANLRDPATSDAIEKVLRDLKYEFVGNSWVNLGGIDWKQYPVTATIEGKPISGVLRFTVISGKIFGVSLLVGGGKDVSQDPELTRIAATFRTFRPLVAQTTPTPGGGPPAAPEKPAETTGSSDSKTAEAPVDYKRLGLIAGGGLLVLLMLFKIIGGSKPPKGAPNKVEKKDAKKEEKPKN